MRLAVLALGVLAGCPGRRAGLPTTSSGAVSKPAPAPAPRRGTMVDGYYADPIGGYRLAVPPGWAWKEGPTDAALQVRVSDPSSGVAVEVWRFTGTDYSLRPRQGCTWMFQDHGPYLGPGGLAPRTVGSCVPVDPTAPRVFAWMVETPDAAWQIEGHVPPAVMVRGLAAVRSVVERFQLEAVPPS